MPSPPFQTRRHVTDLSESYFYHTMEPPGFGFRLLGFRLARIITSAEYLRATMNRRETRPTLVADRD